jgi:hypothetical protein
VSFKFEIKGSTYLALFQPHKNSKKKSPTPSMSMTSTGESLSPHSSDQNIPTYDDDDQYYEDFTPEQSEYEDEQKSSDQDGEMKPARYSFDEMFKKIPLTRERK